MSNSKDLIPISKKIADFVVELGAENDLSPIEALMSVSFAQDFVLSVFDSTAGSEGEGLGQFVIDAHRSVKSLEQILIWFTRVKVLSDKNPHAMRLSTVMQDMIISGKIGDGGLQPAVATFLAGCVILDAMSSNKSNESTLKSIVSQCRASVKKLEVQLKKRGGTNDSK